MQAHEIKAAWGAIDKLVLREDLMIGGLAKWSLDPDRQFATVYGGARQGKSVMAQWFYQLAMRLHQQHQLDTLQPTYINFEYVFGEAMSREKGLSTETRPLSLFQKATIESIRTTFKADNFGQLPSFSQLLEPVSLRRGLVIIDNFERMFKNLQWDEARQRPFFNSVVFSLRDMDEKKKSKFLFMLRPESEVACNNAMKQVEPLWFKLQDLKK